MSSLPESIIHSNTHSQILYQKIQKTETIDELTQCSLSFGRYIAKIAMEEELAIRGKEKKPSNNCPKCNTKLESKGLQSRTFLTWLGEMSWTRRVYRCPNKCHIAQIVPSDESLGIKPYQKTSWEVMRLSCLLAVFLPYELSSKLFFTFTGIVLSPKTIWNWVQIVGKKAKERLIEQLENLSVEEVCEHLLQKAELLLIGSDGVMVPFRPDGGSPAGKTQWKEVKIGVVAWLEKRMTRKGKSVWRVVCRRVVGILGGPLDIQQRLWWAALREGITKANKIVWVSDGAKWLWGIFERQFSTDVYGVLDFYHVTQYAWRIAKIWLDGRTKEAKIWWKNTRQKLWQGKGDEVINELQLASKDKNLLQDTKNSINALHNYLLRHKEHIDYAKCREEGFPMGSGLIESACKWLIQQRFKCVGMRWSEEGFENLLHLRMFWFNGEFDELFEYE
jgi:hypothetical protein